MAKLNEMTNLYIGYIVEIIKDSTGKPTMSLRVRVPSIHGTTVKDEDLPIANPLVQAGSVISSDNFENYIKKINKVYVLFESGDLNKPYYLGIASDPNITNIPLDTGGSTIAQVTSVNGLIGDVVLYTESIPYSKEYKRYNLKALFDDSTSLDNEMATPFNRIKHKRRSSNWWNAPSNNQYKDKYSVFFVHDGTTVENSTKYDMYIGTLPVASGLSEKEVEDLVNASIESHDTNGNAHQSIRDSITLLSTDVSSLSTIVSALNGAYVYRGNVVLTDVNSDDTLTQQELTNRLKEILERDPKLGDVLVDQNQNEWYFNNNSWNDFGTNIVAQATTNSYGIVKLSSKESIATLSSESNDVIIEKQLKGFLDTKVDKEENKGLSTNDFTNALKTKLEGINLSNYYESTQVDDLLDTKVDKISGKGLSTNDFTNDLKTKLTNIDLTNYYTKTSTDNLLADKQDKLVSGTNIKTINSKSILGTGNITTSWSEITGKPTTFPPSPHKHTSADITDLLNTINTSLEPYVTLTDLNTTLDSYYTKTEVDAEFSKLDIEALETALETVQASIDTINAQIETIDASIETIENIHNTIDEINGNINTINTNIVSMNNEISNNTTNINSFQASLTALEGSILDLNNLLDDKVDKVSGKALSSNDFTDDLKTKLDNIESGAQVNTVSSVNSKTGVIVLTQDDIGNGTTYKRVTETEKNSWNNKITKVKSLGEQANKDLKESDTFLVLRTDANGNLTTSTMKLPATYAPSSHTHDDRYYTESEIDDKLSGKLYKSKDKATTEDYDIGYWEENVPSGSAKGFYFQGSKDFYGLNINKRNMYNKILYFDYDTSENSNGTINFPNGSYNLLTDNTDQLITGFKTFQNSKWDQGHETTIAKFKGMTSASTYGSVSFVKEGSNSGIGIRIDQVDGTPRLYFRATATAGAMVWSQPEPNSHLYFDVGGITINRGLSIGPAGVYPNPTANVKSYLGSGTYKFETTYTKKLNNGSDITIPNKSGTLALTSDIPDMYSKEEVNALVDGKQDIILGAATSVLDSNLTQNAVLISNSEGKIATSSITTDNLNTLSGVTVNIQTQLNGKQDTITGAASTITTGTLATNRVLVSSSTGKVGVSAVSSAKLTYLNDVTSSIQAQLNNKQATITGAATTVLTSNLTENRLLISNASGKIATSNFDSRAFNLFNYTPQSTEHNEAIIFNKVASVNGHNGDEAASISFIGRGININTGGVMADSNEYPFVISDDIVQVGNRTLTLVEDGTLDTDGVNLKQLKNKTSVGTGNISPSTRTLQDVHFKTSGSNVVSLQVKTGDTTYSTYNFPSSSGGGIVNQVIESGSYNDIREAGFYTMRGSGVTGHPEGSWNGLIVLKSDIDSYYFEQIAVNESNGNMYVRNQITNWKRVVYDTEISKVIHSRSKSSNLTALTSSSNSITCNYTLNKGDRLLIEVNNTSSVDYTPKVVGITLGRSGNTSTTLSYDTVSWVSHVGTYRYTFSFSISYSGSTLYFHDFKELIENFVGSTITVSTTNYTLYVGQIWRLND